jgi:AcrR family transcriptional regulator
MGIEDRRERERQDLRHKIMEAARTLFATRGYDSVTMRGIAEAIEYSPTAIYYHFRNKDELVQALCEEDFSRLLAYLSEQARHVDPVETIRMLGKAYARFGFDHPNQYRFLFMTAPPHEPPPEGGVEPMAGEQAFGLLNQAVKQAVAQGFFRPGSIDAMAKVLWSSLHGAVALMITVPPEHFPGDPPPPDFIDQVIENNIRGFLDPGKARRKAQARRSAPPLSTGQPSTRKPRSRSRRS